MIFLHGHDLSANVTSTLWSIAAFSGGKNILWSAPPCFMPDAFRHTHTFIYTQTTDIILKEILIWCSIRHRCCCSNYGDKVGVSSDWAQQFIKSRLNAGSDRRCRLPLCTHTCAVCCGGRWIGLQIVSDMLISSPSLTTEALAPAVKEQHSEPSGIFFPSLSFPQLSFFTFLFFLSLPIPSLLGNKEMFHLSSCHMAEN